MPFVEEQLFANGEWENVSNTENNSGETIPLVYETLEEGIEEIAELFDEIGSQIVSGDRAKDLAFDIDDFRLRDLDNNVIYTLSFNEDSLVATPDDNSDPVYLKLAPRFVHAKANT